MTRYKLASLVAATALVFGASAATATPYESAEIQLRPYVGDVDLSDFNQTEIASLMNVLNSGDSFGDTESVLESLIRQYR
ncbi:hypothetical protein ROJ8625_03745 [Roseivivax jejudonensis]|uniref:Uncharacterized protein n=1 Tax=Roseivivax jejudonensis TaxID=1529041 RepID=A0A1X7A6E3_9RHOB|nr:hypothetical protein [Roseivivax jejudonensis]SLN71758.1 hypothetical protein ROJ8625_03745 [Roseivivax jejudonensis]